MSADLVEPYVVIRKVNNVKITDDIVPRMNICSGQSSCQEDTRTVSIPYDSTNVEIAWTVGGAIEVDETKLWFGRWADIPEFSGEIIGVTTGFGEFSESGAATTFRAKINMVTNNFEPGDHIAVIAAAKVDNSWTQVPLNVGPDLPPQSHIVNVRTNPARRQRRTSLALYSTSQSIYNSKMKEKRKLMPKMI